MCRILFGQFALFLLSLPAYAVENPTSPLDRFHLVGIINAADRKGNDASLAVIRDEQLGRSIMVRRGETLPGADGVVVSDIKRSEIDLKIAGQTVSVGYTGTEAKDERKDFSTETLNTDELDAFYYDRRSAAIESEGLLGSTFVAPEIPSENFRSFSKFDDPAKVIEMSGHTVGSSEGLGSDVRTDSEPRIAVSEGGLYNDYVESEASANDAESSSSERAVETAD